MSTFEQNRQPLLLLGAAIAIGLLSYLILFRGTPSPSRLEDEVQSGKPEFQPARHLAEMKADSFLMLLRQVYPTAKVQRSKDKLQVDLAGQGARASDFYNDNPYLPEVRSREFSITQQKRGDEIAAIFTLHTEGGETFLRVPDDILFQLTEKAANEQHGGSDQ